MGRRPPWWRWYEPPRWFPLWYEPPRWFPRWLHLRTCTFCRGMTGYVREQERASRGR